MCWLKVTDEADRQKKTSKQIAKQKNWWHQVAVHKLCYVKIQNFSGKKICFNNLINIPQFKSK